MDFFIFSIEYLIPGMARYLMLTVFFGIIYFFAYKKQVYGLFDPLVFQLIGAIFSASLVVFLFFSKVIKQEYLMQFFCTEFSFFIGAIIFSKKKINNIKELRPQLSDAYSSFYISILFFLSSLSFIIVQVFVYLKLGIPLFYDNKSRLEAFAGNGGIYYILSSLQFILSIIIANRIIVKKFLGRNIYKNIFTVFITSFLIISLVFTGAKSSFLNFVFLIFACVTFNVLKGNLNKKIYDRVNLKMKLFLLISFIVAITVIQITSSGSILESISSLGIRLVASGDVYVLSYPNNTYTNIEEVSSLIYLFGGNIVSILNHIFKLSIYVPKAIGFQLTELVYNSDAATGPNARHNIFGLIFYGFGGSMLFSFFLGFLQSFFRNRFINLLPSNLIGSIYFCLAFTTCCALMTDVTLVINEFFFRSVIIFTILILVYFITVLLKNTKI